MGKWRSRHERGKRSVSVTGGGLPGVHLNTTQTNAISRMMADTVKESTYYYPWRKLEKAFEARRISEITVIGYGSLVNKAEIAKTLCEKSLVTCQPVIAFGVRRLFNYDMPLDLKRYEPPIHPLARAALNVRLTGNVDDVVNGIAMKLSSDDIPSMKKRELEYDLIPVVCLRWNELEKPPFLAHILCCFDGFREGKRHTNDKIEPHRQYYSLCRKGASEYGEEFLRLWLATTYLADAITPVAQWEATEFPEVR